MIKQGIKNFFVNLQYYFTPLGVLSLGVIIGFSVFIPTAVAAVRDLAERVAEITGSATINFSVLKDCIVDAVSALDWSSPLDAARTMLGKDWMSQTLSECIYSLLSEGEIYAEQITQAMETALSKVSAGLSALIAFTVLGIVGGHFLTKLLVRRKTAKRSLWKFFLSSIVESVLSAALIVLIVWIQTLWGAGAPICAVLSSVLVGLFALLKAYIVYGLKRVDRKEIVNLKNVGMLWLTNLIILAVTCVFALMILALTNVVVAVFTVLPLMEIAFLVIGLNAEAYVIQKVEEQSLRETPEKADA